MLRKSIISERIRAARYAAHLTQTDLAGQRYSKSFISAIERAKMTPSLQTLQRLAACLKVPISYLLGEDTRGNDTLAQEQHAREEEQAREEQHARHLLSAAEALLQQGRYEEAIARFQQLGHKDRISSAHEQYAHFLAAQGRFQEAYEQMQRALH